ncbi:DUF1501 domain-containing protein [Actinoplanes sp. CA-030573]|uniref:DUF1501 domain-containing protein n=1 Tax=Actinoplanes sp. CA-030573 TaxID=3239898 RepID=UPI003D8F81E9
MTDILCRRRTLLAGAAAGLAATMLDTRFAFAADPTGSRDVFVLLSLRGGFDGLSAIVPAADSSYYTLRPTIGVPQRQLLAGDGFFGLHPALAPLLPYWQNGTFGAVHAAGQPTPNRSHFAAMEELERAAPGTAIRTGWLDRVLGGFGSPGGFGGVSIGSPRPARVLAGAAPHLGVSSIDGFKLDGDVDGRPLAATMAAMYQGAPDALATTTGQMLGALGAVKKLQAAGYTPAVTYPATDLGNALKDVARLVKAGVGLRTATLDCGDWDMHEDLGAAVAGKRYYDKLNALASALAAFAADLGPDGLRRVTLVTISEFGRRAAQNGSAGLDHGYGNAMLLLGGNVKGGKVYGRWPGLAPAQLIDGDLAVTTDYRSVIAEILRVRCGLADSSSVFPGVATSSLGLVAA